MTEVEDPGMRDTLLYAVRVLSDPHFQQETWVELRCPHPGYMHPFDGPFHVHLDIAACFSSHSAHPAGGSCGIAEKAKERPPQCRQRECDIGGKLQEGRCSDRARTEAIRRPLP